MPGSTINTTILTASNQLIKSQNDIETAITAVQTAILAGNQEVTGAVITAIETAILAGNESLAAMADPIIQYHPYLEYLKYLKIIADKDLYGQGGTIPGTFGGDNQVYLSDKCIAANWIYQTVYDFFDFIDKKNIGDITTLTATGLIELLMAGLTAAIAGTVGVPILILTAIPAIATGILLLTQFNASSVLDALEENKSEIVGVLYNSVTIELSMLPAILPGAQISNIARDVTDVIDQSYALSETVEKQLIGLIIDYCSLTYLFRENSHWPSKWQAGPPSGAVTCGDVACIAGNASLSDYPTWTYGTPSLLVGGEFTDGQTTAQWDSQVYKVLFRSVLGNPISFSIDAISTPSIDITVHHCDGTMSQQSEVLAAAFPITILDALEVHLMRTSSAPTVTLDF